MTYLDMQNCK